MSKKWISLAIFFLLIVSQGYLALAQEARARYEMMELIRKEKFDLVLPGAMRDNDVDMWIHVIRRGDPDPLELDFGVRMGGYIDQTLCFIIFTDRGVDRIERAVLGGRSENRDLYDIFGSESDLLQFVSERDPERIAVNMSKWLVVADGLSHTGYVKLVEMLGDKYARRLVSAENVITDFRVRRVQTEIIAFAKACEIQRQIMEEAYRRIVPGITTREEIGWWVQDQLLAKGLSPLSSGPSAPSAIHSEVPRSQRGDVYHRGDLLTWDWGIRYLNFGTDYKRNAYILKDGESDIPDGLKYAWNQGMKAREIIRKNFKIGRTAGENLKIIGLAFEKAGFGYIPNDPTTDGGFSGLKPGDHLKHPDKTEVSVDCHCVGNTGNSQIAVGPSMAPFRPRRAHITVQQNNLFAFEYVCYTAVPEWSKEKLRINFEDNAIVTEKGVEFLYPPNRRIILIR